jgi:drug/metabolite transporter (DMT)-like permease
VLTEFLIYLAGIGAVFGASWFIEYFELFKTLESKQKQLAFFGVCVFVGIGAQLVLQFVPSNVIEIMTPYFAILGSIFSYLFLGDVFHKSTKL